MAERIREMEWGTLLALTRDARAINDALLKVTLSQPPPSVRTRAGPARCNVIRDYYQINVL